MSEKQKGWKRGDMKGPHVSDEMSVFSSFWDSTRKSIYEFNTASERYTVYYLNFTLPCFIHQEGILKDL